MPYRSAVVLLFCVSCAGCVGRASSPPAVPQPATPDLTGAASARLRTFVSERSGIRSVVLAPSLVDGLESAGPGDRSRVLAGAFFVTRSIPEGEVSGLALVFQSVGGGLGPALSVEPTLRMEVDGESMLDAVQVDPSMFDVSWGPWGPVESIVLPVSPFLMHSVSGAERVRVRIGDSLSFELNAEQRSGVGELLREIPEGTRFGVRKVVARGRFLTR